MTEHSAKTFGERTAVNICLGIHVHAQPQQLRATLGSVRQHTASAVRVVLLPDGPDAETQAALRSLNDLDQISTDKPLGAAACFNRLAVSSDSAVLVLLESGSMVGPRWLDHLLAALDADPRHGLAGPSTNRAWNEQGVFPRGQGAADAIAQTAKDAERRFGSTWRTLEPLYSLADFCYVVRREVIEAIGAADESYGLGPCWEMDYNIRAARAGWRGVWACAAYVYRAPFTARRQREERLRFEASKQRYQDKFCGLRLRGERHDYETHCRGEACEHFAPAHLIQITEPSLLRADTTDRAVQQMPRVIASSLPAENPLVTCIMPTYNRRAFVPRALEYFLRQDYARKELIIVDDGTDPIGDLIPNDERLHYVRLAERQTIGAKRNQACARTRGEFIVHWDDDDWYPADRVRRQVQAMIDQRANVCGSSHVYYYDPATDRAWRYEHGSRSPLWVAGNTLAYRRELWARNQFMDIQVGEDARFLWSPASKVVHDLQDPALCIGVIHEANVSRKEVHGTYWHAEPSERIHELLGDDLRLYRTAAPLSPLSPLPLVSCIMPTYNRRAFVPLALDMFARQDYPNKELLVVDDGTDPVRDLVETTPYVRYLRLNQRTTIGAKRNLACQEARGDIIAQWDDDDWYAPNRLSYQVTPILADQADLTGLENVYMLTLPQGEFWTVRPQLHQRMFVGDVHGGTLTMRRTIFDHKLRYPEVNLAEDAGLIRLAQQQGKRLMRLANPGIFVYVRHSNNTWRFETGRFLDPAGWECITSPETFPPGTLELYRAITLPRRP